MKVDLDLMFQSFAEAYRENPEVALRLLQALLLDERACLARIELLKRVRGRVEAGLPDLRGTRGEADFATEIRAIVETGTARAVHEGKLAIGRLDALTRDPDALWKAHLALVGHDNGPPTGFTALARQANWQELAESFRPYAPILLEEAGLDVECCDELVDFVAEQARSLGEGQSFREALRHWIKDFVKARQRPGQATSVPETEEDWMRIVGIGAVIQTLEDQRRKQAGVLWARGFCERCIDARPSSPQDILRVDLPHGLERSPALPGFRRGLVDLAVEQHRAGLELFELN